MNDKRHLFICGCPRSGTTALWRLLTASPEIVLGVERFGMRLMTEESIRPEHFEKTRFFQLEDGDTFYDDLDRFQSYYSIARERFSDADIVGDKIPFLYYKLAHIGRQFPGAKVVFIFRNIFDVAASYQRRAENSDDHYWRRNQGVECAVKDWHDAIEAFTHSPFSLDIYPVSYEDLFMSEVGLEALMTFLNIKNRTPIRECYKFEIESSLQLELRRNRQMSLKDIMTICREAPFDKYRRILHLCNKKTGGPEYAWGNVWVDEIEDDDPADTIQVSFDTLRQMRVSSRRVLPFR